MDDAHLFAWFRQQEPSVLIEVLQHAYDAMTIPQRRDVFGPVMQQIPPAPVDGEALYEDIDTFYRESVAGVYYAPFDIDSRNFSHIPEETEEWFDQLDDFLAQSTVFSDQGQHRVFCISPRTGIFQKFMLRIAINDIL